MSNAPVVAFDRTADLCHVKAVVRNSKNKRADESIAIVTIQRCAESDLVRTRDSPTRVQLNHRFVDAAALIFLAAFCNAVKTVVPDSLDVRRKWGRLISKEVLKTTDICYEH